MTTPPPPTPTLPTPPRERSPLVDIAISTVIGLVVLVPGHIVGIYDNPEYPTESFETSGWWPTWMFDTAPVILFVILLLIGPHTGTTHQRRCRGGCTAGRNTHIRDSPIF
ncbi:hypothetical protein [Gordonia effusa]|uniref:hypothetical protein n=1 Tax=Gordonia effusa TaxID=263908 RepID=UPI0002F5DAE2|nr:hypothetical protein [Gordonia effusa]